MSKVVDWFRDQGHRAYVYRVLAAAGVVAGGTGYVTGEQVAVWLGFAATLLGTGTAVANTSTKKSEAGEVFISWSAVTALACVGILVLLLVHWNVI